MYGAIIGDLVGSIYEYDEFRDSLKGKINLERRLQILSKKELITAECFYSDDTILTIAILSSILDNIPYEENLRKYAKLYKNSIPTNMQYFNYMFSPGFLKWAESNSIGKSAGNGAAMRISPVAYLFNEKEEIIEETKKATIPSHNNKEAIEGALAVTKLILKMP